MAKAMMALMSPASAAAPLPEGDFLLDAVGAAPAVPQCFDDDRIRWWDLDRRLVWLIDLFERLERQRADATKLTQRCSRVASGVWNGELEMENGFLAFMEMFIILAFALGWGVLELVTLRLDRKRKAERERSEGEAETSDRA